MVTRGVTVRSNERQLIAETQRPFVTENVTGSYVVKSANAEQQIVFGWANISLSADGTEVVDSHDEAIAPDDLEAAAYDFVVFERSSGEDHDAGYAPDGVMVESMMFTKEKLAALATDPNTGVLNDDALRVMSETIPTGWWVGFHIPDAEAFARARSEKSAFSIEGVAIREEA